MTGTAEASYRHGLGDTIDVDGAAFDAQARHRVFGFLFGVLF